MGVESLILDLTEVESAELSFELEIQEPEASFCLSLRSHSQHLIGT